MLLDDILGAIGYTDSAFYRESPDSSDLAVAHLLRDARRADVRGTYFFRTAPGKGAEARERPAVHVAEAKTADEARNLHKKLWNQGVNPFVVILLPNQIRVYTGFEFDPRDEQVGLIDQALDTRLGLATIGKQLAYLTADSIDSGAIWQLKGHHLKAETRVDQELLRNLDSLSDVLVSKHRARPPDAHAVIGKFVYLYYLKHRDILSEEWMRNSGVEPDSVFSINATLTGFRRLCDAVDTRFNGNIFPIHWSSDHAPSAEAVKEVARTFAGEVPQSGQMHLPFGAYDFSFIPIELLSAIYEQFLHDQGKGRNAGAFYTPEPAADYLISELDSVKKLKPGMKILDPCCGSGIFLVLAYRRLIELERQKRNNCRLTPRELRNILCDSIYGVERNRDACLVTELSLILTMLSYVEPPELHRNPTFTFPDLHNDRIFESDFFSDDSAFARLGLSFDWIVGNPPWMEIDPNDAGEQPTVTWIKSASATAGMPVPRFRAAEAFTWRVRDRAAPDGVIALFIQASTLTNAQLKEYRQAFFSKNTVHRITNFANLAYVLFPSAEEAAATVVYSATTGREAKPPIIHYGPLVVNQVATRPGDARKKRTAWSVTICENEIQAVPSEEAAKGGELTWKLALWGNHRDRRILDRIRRLFPNTLGGLAQSRNWRLNLGLQLRRDVGTKQDPNELVSELQGVSVFAGEKFLDSSYRFSVPASCLEANSYGTFVRVRGGKGGVAIVRGPHLFLWNNFAAFSEKDFIFRHPKIGLAAPEADSDFLRAISVVWSSCLIQYYLFFHSSSWGIGRSTIDLGDAEHVPMPDFSDEQVQRLVKLHRQLVQVESTEPSSSEIQTTLDTEISEVLGVPYQVALVAREFVEIRLRLVKGKAPSEVTKAPSLGQLEAYAKRLAAELDAFVPGKGRHHLVSVLKAVKGVVATVEIIRSDRSLKPVVRDADATDAESVRALLKLAEKRLSQWAYVQRGMRVFAGSKIHICKLPRRLDWTETQALLDSDDVVAEVVEARGKNA
jgi:N-6 DNA Methylase